MLPSGCCTDAIASMVCATCAAVMMPATWGRGSDQARLRFPYLAADGGTFSPYTTRLLPSTGLSARSVTLRPARVVLDQVAEELVVALHGRGVGVVEPVRALEPPVGRVERVRVVRAAEEAARAFDLRLELVLTVDAHVRARRVVVQVVDRPRDALGPAGRHRRREPTTGPQHAHDLDERALVVPDVLEHLRHDARGRSCRRGTGGRGRRRSRRRPTGRCGSRRPRSSRPRPRLRP